MSSRPVCMIGGSGRSGTTILKTIFANHPSCVRVPEYRFSIDPDGLIDFYSSFDAQWSPYHFDVRLTRLESLLRDCGRNSFVYRLMAFLGQKYAFDRFFSRTVIPRYAGIAYSRECPSYDRRVDELMQRLVTIRYAGHWNGSRLFSQKMMHFREGETRNQVKLILRDFWRAVINDTCEFQGRGVFIEDNTWNILCFKTILELLPEAKLVHVMRDPRDVVASYTKMRWAPTDPIDAAAWLKSITDQWSVMRSELPPHKFLEIRLEDLVDEPQHNLQKVCEFWGVRWDDCLMKTDLSKAHVGRWRRDLSREEGDEVSRMLETAIVDGGYCL